MKATLKKLSVIIALLAMAGCGNNLVRDKSNDYLLSEEVPPMIVPEGKSSGAIGQLYDVPAVPDAGAGSEYFVVPRPQPLSENVFEETVKIETFSGSRWIAINKPAEEVWPRIRNILSRSSVPTTRVDASSGIIETGWLQFKDDEDKSHRFRFKIVPGIGVNSTEVSLLQMSAPIGKEGDAGSWPAKSMDDSRELEFVEIVSNSLASEINSGSVSLLAQTIGGREQVEVVSSADTDPYIKMNLNYDRAWASLLNSLSRGGYTIIDQNRSAGRLQVEFQEIVAEEQGQTLKEWVLNLGNKVEKVPPVEYWVELVRNEQTVEVRIADKSRDKLERSLAIKLLKVIRGNLS